MRCIAQEAPGGNAFFAFRRFFSAPDALFPPQGDGCPPLLRPAAHCQPGAKPLQERSSCRGPLRPALRHPNPLFRHDRRDRLPHRRPGPRRPRPAPPRGRRACHFRRGLPARPDGTGPHHPPPETLLGGPAYGGAGGRGPGGGHLSPRRGLRRLSLAAPALCGPAALERPAGTRCPGAHRRSGP